MISSLFHLIKLLRLIAFYLLPLPNQFYFIFFLKLKKKLLRVEKMKKNQVVIVMKVNSPFDVID